MSHEKHLVREQNHAKPAPSNDEKERALKRIATRGGSYCSDWQHKKMSFFIKNFLMSNIIIVFCYVEEHSSAHHRNILFLFKP